MWIIHFRFIYFHYSEFLMYTLNLFRRFSYIKFLNVAIRDHLEKCIITRWVLGRLV